MKTIFGQPQAVVQPWAFLIRDHEATARVRFLSAATSAEQDEYNAPHLMENFLAHSVMVESPNTGRPYRQVVPCVTECRLCGRESSDQTLENWAVWLYHYETMHGVEPEVERDYVQEGEQFTRPVRKPSYWTVLRSAPHVLELSEYYDQYRTLLDRDYLITRHGRPGMRGGVHYSAKPIEPEPLSDYLQSLKLATVESVLLDRAAVVLESRA